MKKIITCIAIVAGIMLSCAGCAGTDYDFAYIMWSDGEQEIEVESVSFAGYAGAVVITATDGTVYRVSQEDCILIKNP